MWQKRLGVKIVGKATEIGIAKHRTGQKIEQKGMFCNDLKV